MLTNEVYTPINCDDYDNLELACQNKWVLTLALKKWRAVAGAGRRHRVT